MLGKSGGDITTVFTTSTDQQFSMPSRFSDLKKQLWKDSLIHSWCGVLQALKIKTDQVVQRGSGMIPKVSYAEIRAGLSAERIAEIKDAGVLVVRGAVSKDEALGWKASIKDYIKQNSSLVKGAPSNDIVFYELYNTEAQIKARTHPAIVETQRTLLSLWHNSDSESEISLSEPIAYFDRLRIRNPGPCGFVLGPHIDGGGIERWEDPGYRNCYHKIFEGGDGWIDHDPFDASPRLTANQDLYNAPNQCSIFRPWQGWTSLSTTYANEGTLRVLPFVKLSTAYVILRAFFKPRPGFEGSLEPSDWELDLEDPNFPGSDPGKAQNLSPETHPHLRLDETIVPIDVVEPGDQVYWHCDVVHAVEEEHTGSSDSSVLYIPAVPLTYKNAVYLRTQRHTFEKGIPPPDFPGGEGESAFQGRYKPDDIPATADVEARRMLGLAPFDVGQDETPGSKRVVQAANAVLFA